ncbi:5'/3'-nucleotidase SurE [Pseudonocardia phyllosphaerae]|uniref:5'/3'-nucleotidase SurE n=1 Tax=Pseudonocardia phyllosphaerae TaxID=3390502 RepID=UPI00397C5D3B
MPLALITNDDGIGSPGLYPLARGARDAGYEVIVAAPADDASGAGGSVRSVTEQGRTAVVEHDDIDALDGIPAFSVAGDPAFIVHAAARGWLAREPDVVLSGINIGANTGGQVLHSGTVGAVLTGAVLGVSGIAFSLACGVAVPEHPHWETVTALLPELLERLRGRPAGTPWTVNVPDVAPAELPPLREAVLCATGAARVRMSHRAPERGPDGVRPGGLRTVVSEVHDEALPGTDVALLAAGHPTVTELRPIGSVTGATGYPA